MGETRCLTCNQEVTRAPCQGGAGVDRVAGGFPLFLLEALLSEFQRSTVLRDGAHDTVRSTGRNFSFYLKGHGYSRTDQANKMCDYLFGDPNERVRIVSEPRQSRAIPAKAGEPVTLRRASPATLQRQLCPVGGSH